MVSIVKRLVGCGVATGAGVPTMTRSRASMRSSKVLAVISWSMRSSCSSRVNLPSAYAVLSRVATWSRSASEARKLPPAMGPTFVGSGRGWVISPS